MKTTRKTRPKPVAAARIHRLRGSLKGTGVLKALMDDRQRERGR